MAEEPVAGSRVSAGIGDLVAAICDGFDGFAAASAERRDGDGPLGWPGYDQQRALAQQRTELDESVLCGQGWIGQRRAVVIAFEFGFLGGSVGRDTGARIVAAFDHARALRIPVVSLVASGGSRLQEGFHALSQLQAIARACMLARQAGIPHITVLRNPTTGGMWGSLGASADVVLASPGATVAFGGGRVRKDGESDTDPAFTAEGKLASGQVDQLVRDEDLPVELARVVELLHPDRLGESRRSADVPEYPGERSAGGPLTSGWDAVQRARASQRPRARAYLDRYFDTWFELSGDRVGGVDAGMLCGLGTRHGRTVAYAAQTGMANTPAGFRTASRLITLAQQLGIAVLTLVDTPGAANDAAAERDGLGPALAELFGAVAQATVPITTLVIGEGGSGGALALAAPENMWISADAYFTVIAPELGARILKRGAAEVPELADRMRLRPQDLLEAGFVRGIVR